MVGECTGRTLKTTRTSLRVFELVLEYNGLALADLDDMLDRPKSSLYSHLRTLEDARYLVRDGGTYHVGYRMALLGQEVERRYPATSVAPPVVGKLAEKTGKEANFTLLEHGRLLLVHGASGESAAENPTEYRTEYYLHNTAAGRAILAGMDRDRVERVLDEWALPRETEKTITDRDHLFEVLADTAERGYGLVEEEVSPGLVSVGAPVHDNEGIVGGLSVGGPVDRVDTTRLEGELVDPLFEAVDTIERQLDGR
ncbi:MAG: ArcR family transcriptional regulator [Halobacteriales archaeon SW_9_67_25]|jgi:DNA-binding IclR family transcriptional regulator|nr:MAG: ArcR family transcriptional regulator [Halobacteriales archaeon SW_9_67_25]